MSADKYFQAEQGYRNHEPSEENSYTSVYKDGAVEAEIKHGEQSGSDVGQNSNSDNLASENLTLENVSITDSVSNQDHLKATDSRPNTNERIHEGSSAGRDGTSLEESVDNVASQTEVKEGFEKLDDNSDSEEEYESAEEGEEIHVDAQNLREMEENLSDEEKEVNL